jgi:hypothetical protein
MKNSILIILLSLPVLWGCQNTPTALSDADKEQIKEDILNENTVVLTTIGSFQTEGDTTSQPWVIAYTQLWRKEESGWKIFHMHNSWK